MGGRKGMDVKRQKNVEVRKDKAVEGSEGKEQVLVLGWTIKQSVG